MKRAWFRFISSDDVTAVCCGLNGADWDSDYAALRELVSPLFPGKPLTILNDCIPAFRAGARRDEYTGVCAGTGINIAFKKSGESPFILGYFADYAIQGAGALGGLAYKRIMDAHVGACGETVLTEMILGYTGHDSCEHLLYEVSLEKYSLPADKLAPLVTQACALGDREAIFVVEQFCNDVARYLIGGMQKQGMNKLPRIIDLVFSGSVFRNTEPMMTDRIFRTVETQVPNIRKVNARYEPVCGTVLTLLDDEYKNALPPDVTDNFDMQAKARGLYYL
jgi:N-acetylglucosamine kinase-like BadF-type ATPase